MKNLIRLGNKNVSVNEQPTVKVMTNTIKLNTSACLLLGAIPKVSRIDVGVDGKGKGAEVYITVVSGSDSTVGRALSKNSTVNSASIKAALAQFETNTFLITEEKTVFEGETWYRLQPVEATPEEDEVDSREELEEA